MDLALELKQPVETLKRSMTEREVRQWMRYANSRMLPTRRVELYLAQIALVVAQAMGNGRRRLKLTDFMFEPIEADDTEPSDDLEAAMDHFDFKPNAGEGVKA